MNRPSNARDPRRGVRTLALAAVALVGLFGALLCSPHARVPATTAAIGDPAPDAAAVAEPPVLAVTTESAAVLSPRPIRPHPPSPNAALSKAVTELAGLLRAGLEGSAVHGELQRCRGSSERACRQLLSRALQQAIADRALPALLSGEVEIRSLQALGASEVYASLGALIAGAPDPVERVAALLALQAMDLPLQPLPPAAYRDLTDRPEVEVQLLYERHAELVLDDRELARAAGELAASADIEHRTRDAALIALGHAPTAPQLTAAVHALAAKHDASWPGWLSGVAPAIGRCGTACIDAVALLVSGAGERREVVQELMRSLPPPQRAEVRGYAATSLSARAAALFSGPLESTLPEG